MKKIISNRLAGIGGACITLAAVMAMTLSMSVTAFADGTDVTEETEAGTAVKYSIDPAFTVTIPETVTIGGSSVTVSASDVVLDTGKKLSVTISGTSDESNAFTVSTSGNEDTLTYTVKSGETDYVLNDAVLTVDPASTDSGSVELTFALASGQTAKYSSEYSGTMTFTVSVVDAQ